MFAYSKGITSSREMQWCCETNIIFKALSCDTVPHFTTLAKFVSSHTDEIEDLFEQVLLVCHEKACWATNSSPLTAARCPPMPQRSGLAPSRSWARSERSCDV
ncbi:transposase [Halomonas sp. I1]|uniref:transposase n=1 Tax=Halomonas sp. I1 TaxID=393536 RepID=UPI0028DEE5EE|nr:transposase [Halomonas sp. I1]MDT8895234.1 transposase [Halomonas sp. I1]